MALSLVMATTRPPPIRSTRPAQSHRASGAILWAPKRSSVDQPSSWACIAHVARKSSPSRSVSRQRRGEKPCAGRSGWRQANSAVHREGGPWHSESVFHGGRGRGTAIFATVPRRSQLPSRCRTKRAKAFRSDVPRLSQPVAREICDCPTVPTPRGWDSGTPVKSPLNGPSLRTRDRPPRPFFSGD